MAKVKNNEAGTTPVKKSKKSTAATPVENKKVVNLPSKRTEEDVKQTRDTLRTLESQIYESKTNYNNIVSLIKYTNLDEYTPEEVIYGSQALRRVFTSLMKAKEFSLRSTGNDKQEAASKKVAEWLSTQAWKTCKILLKYVMQRNVLSITDAVVISSIDVLFDLATVDAHNDLTRLVNLDSTSLLPQIIAAIFADTPNELIISDLRVKWVKKYDDVRYGVYKVITKLIQKRNFTDYPIITEYLASDFEFTTFNENLLTLLVSMKWGEISFENLFSSINSKKLVPAHGSHPDIVRQKKELSSLWISLIRTKFTPRGYTMILSILETVILPNINQPLALCDFLSDAFEQGGLSAILALSGLLVLITKHNLDYPKFFSKLYSLCTPAAMASNQSRFLKLLERVLSGPSIPTYIITAFSKRLLRVALFSQPSVGYFILAFIFNLVRKHPIASSIVNRNMEVEKGKIKNAQMSGELVKQVFRPNTYKNKEEGEQQEDEDAKQEEGEQQQSNTNDSDNEDEDTEEGMNDSEDDENKEETAKPVQSLFSLLSAAGSTKPTDSKIVASTLLLNDTNIQLTKDENAWVNGKDPFVEYTDEPANACAMETSLLELTLLTNHYLADLTRLAKLYHADNAPKMGHNMEHYLGQSYEVMFEAAVKFKENRMTATTFTQPNTLLGKSERIVNPDEKYDEELAQQAKKLETSSVMEMTFDY